MSEQATQQRYVEWGNAQQQKFITLWLGAPGTLTPKDGPFTTEFKLMNNSKSIRMQKRHKTPCKQQQEGEVVMAWMLVHPQIHNAFAALGVQHGDAYQVSEDCLAILGDILAKLSIEDRTLRTFRRAVGFGQHIRKNLVPLLIHVKDEPAGDGDHTRILDATIKLLVNLTIPVECLLSLEAVGKTVVGRHTIFEINKLLYNSKEAFVDSRSIKAVTDHMKFVLERGAKLELEQCDSINNCLLLLRNILHIPEHRGVAVGVPRDPNAGSIASPHSHSSTSMQNKILWNLFTQSIDKLILHLISFPQKFYWVITLVQLISLMYKDQHVCTLQKLLSVWWESAWSESSDDNESNTSPPPPNQGSGGSSPILTSTSDPTTSDSSDNAQGPHVVRSQQNRNKVLLTSNKHKSDDSSSSSSQQEKKDVEQSSATYTAAYNSLRAQKRKLNNRTETPPPSAPAASSSPSTSSSAKEAKTAASELSDYGYGTQVENQESISTSSNDDDAPQSKPQKPHMVQKPRIKVRKEEKDRNELRRKKLIKRSKINIINIKGLLHHSPNDEDISNILKEFTVDFLLKGYSLLVGELHAQILTPTPVAVDTSHIFWLLTYFLKFATQLEVDFEHLESVLSVDILGYLTYEGVNLCEELEMAGPGEVKPCLRRMHLVVTAIKEFLLALDTYPRLPHLTASHAEKLEAVHKQLASTDNLPYLLLLLIRRFRPEVHSKRYLQDLVTTNHQLLLMLDSRKKGALQEHLKHFANVEVMHVFGLLLEDFESNGKFINDCVFTMMHHIGGDIDNVATLFQPNILKTFSKIWESDYEICDDWSDLIEYVIHKFINVPRQPSQLPSTPNLTTAGIECGPISPQLENNENGDDHDDEWTEEESDSLYWYFLQSRKHPSLLSRIASLYLDSGVTKSHKSILRQLLAQGLITRAWYEQLEVRELQTHALQSKILGNLREKLRSEGLDNGVEWLKKELMEVVKCKVMVEREEKGMCEPVPYCYIKLHQSIPLVPWYKELSNILKNKTFISLIHRLGFHLPCDTRKLFIRIPQFWTATHTYRVAQQLGPIDPASLQFDINLLNAEEPTSPPMLDPKLLREENEEEENVSNSVEAQYVLPNTSSNWFHTVLHSKVKPEMRFNPDTQSTSCGMSTKTSEKCHEDPDCLPLMYSLSPEPAGHLEHAADVDNEEEQHSVCETASVTSDLTRMYVSDEEDRH